MKRIIISLVLLMALAQAGSAQRSNVRTPRYLGDRKYEDPFTKMTFIGEKPQPCYWYECTQSGGCVRVKTC
jgi:hypothetical protein